MPLPWSIDYFLLDQLDQHLIRCLGLSIGLSIVRRRIQQLKSHICSEILEFLRYEYCPLISCDSLGNPKSINDMFLDKVSHVLGHHCLQRDCFNPLGEIICRHHYELMAFARWWINLADYVNSPTSERPWLDYRIHREHPIRTLASS